MIVYPFGADLCLWHFEQKNKRDYLKYFFFPILTPIFRTTRNGFTAFTVNNARQLIAAAEYGINPEILLFRFPFLKDRKEPLKIKCDAKIQITAMDFSRDGSRLVAASGLPDYSLTVYDTETGTQLPGIREKFPDKTLRKILFKPTKPNDPESCFAVMTATGLYVYRIEQVGEYKENQLTVSYKLVRKELDEKIEGTDMLWDRKGRLVVSDKVGKRVVIYDTVAGEKLVEVEHKEFEHEPLALLLAQTQLIVSLSDGTLKWYEYSYENQGPAKKDPMGGKATAAEIIGKDPQQEITIEYGPFCYMVYNNPMTKIVGTTHKGTLVMVPCEAQCEDEEEDQAEALLPGKDPDAATKAREKPKILPAKLSDFLTGRIISIRELPSSTQVASLSEDGTVSLWENTSMQLLARLEIKSAPTCFEVDARGEAGFVGSVDGCVRVVDLSDRMILRVVKVVKLFKGGVTRIKRSPDGTMLAVCSDTEKGIYFVSTNAAAGFPIIAYLPLVGRASSVDWLQADPGAPPKLIAILHNSLLVALTPPAESLRNQILDLAKVQATYCVVDNYMRHLICSPAGDILITGHDRKIRKYELPDTLFNDIDPRKPASAPVGEFPGHGLDIQCWAISSDGKLLVSGGRDGTYQIRMLSSLGQAKEGKSHSVHQGGVTAISFSPARNLIYVGGGDGTFMLLNMSKEPLPTAPKTPTDIGEALKTLDEVEDHPGDADKIMLEKWHEEEIARKEEEKAKLKTLIKQELHSVKEALKDLLQKNEGVQEIEKLDREEFLIDKARKELMLAERDEESEKLKKVAARENLRAEVLKERIKERTWDTMEVQNTGCKSLNSEQIIFNFHIRKQGKGEVDQYGKLSNLRRLEIKDSVERRAEELLLDKSDFSKECEHYVVNRFPNQPTIQEEVQERLVPESVQSPQVGFLNSPNKPTGPAEKEKVTYKYRRPGVAARGGKRVVADVEDKFGKDKKEEQKQDDIRLSIKQEKKEIEYYRKNWKTLEGYELLYEPFELQSNARKRAQIVFIQEIIRRMKKEFNKEFEALCSYKSEQISLINEKNQKIEELQRELKEAVTKFEIKSDKREQPDHILTVTPADITIPKYLSKEEREKLEEEKRKEEERLKALQSDTLGRRGINTMMGGVLEVKRELDELEKELVRQAWMDLPEGQMTEAQRQEFTKFRQREEDFKERKLNQQKAWRQELCKARNEIDELCQKFEEKMAKLMKKKHFVQLRIYEQELYIVRLSLSLYEERLLRDSKAKTETEMRQLHELFEKYKEIHEALGILHSPGSPSENGDNPEEPQRVSSREADRYQSDQNYEQNIRRELGSRFQGMSAQEFEAIWRFVQRGREALRGIQEREKKMAVGKDRKEDSVSVFKRSPYYLVDQEIIDQQENYNPRTDNLFAKLGDDRFPELVEFRLKYVNSAKAKAAFENETRVKAAYEETLRQQLQNTDQELRQKEIKLYELSKEIVEYEENIEALVRIKQGQVEISLIEIAPNLDQAVLIKRQVILELNQEIKKFADELYNKLKEGSTTEKQRKKNDWRIKVLDKEIKYLDTCISTVMQERIGRHPVFKKRDEIPMLEADKLKTLQSQIHKLEENANRRIKAIKSKIMTLDKQIADKVKENEELEQNARKREETVKQKMEILDLSSGGGGEEVKQETENKMKIIGTKRKLKDMLLQQEEEFMMLSEELNRIREKTFPSFAHIQAKYEYPDEKAP